MDKIKYCPLCGKKVDAVYESPVWEPFAHYNLMLGLDIYGPASATKHTVCLGDDFLHFTLERSVHRLVRLGINHPIPPEESDDEQPPANSPDDYEKKYDVDDDDGLPF